MDPELKKMLEAAHAAGASDEDLRGLIDRWHADHDSHGPVDVSAQLQQQVDAREAEARKHPVQPIAGKGVARALNAFQGIPGGKLVEAVALAKQNGISRQHAVQLIDNTTDQLGGGEKFLGKLVAGAPLALIPGSPAMVGAGVGGADALLDPQEESGGQRAFNTGLGAAGGAVAGRVLDRLVTMGRARFAPRFAKGKFDLEDAANDINDVNYGESMDAAMGREAPPHIQALLNNRHFGPRVDRVLQSPRFENMDPTDPRVLNEVYKNLTDEETSVMKGLQPIEPTKGNTKRATLKDIRELKDQLLNAMSRPGQKPPLALDVAPETHVIEPRITPGRDAMRGPMLPGTANQYGDNETTLNQIVRDFPGSPAGRQGPAGPGFALRAQPEDVKPGVEISTPGMHIETAPAKDVPAFMPEYPAAVDAARQGKSASKAFSRGYNTLLANARYRGNAMPEKIALAFSPDAVERAAGKMTDADKAEMVQGILSGVKASPKMARGGRIPLPWTSAATREAPGLLRAVNAPDQATYDILAKLGFTSLNSQITP